MKTTRGPIAVILSCGLAVGAVADSQVVASGGIANKSDFGRHYLDAMPRGAIIIYAGAEDNLGVPPVDMQQKTGNYATGRSISTPAAVSWGPSLVPIAAATISWGYAPAPGQWYWDSTGSFATIIPLPFVPPAVEVARAHAISNDPNVYEATWAPFEQDMLTVEVSFLKGLSLDTLNRADATARISGSAFNSEVGGDLWRYDWTLDQHGPSFTFWSDPSLGLNDAAIMSAFNAQVQTVGSSLVLAADVTISASMMVQADASGFVSITSGGGTNYEVNDVNHPVPTPGAVGMAALAIGTGLMRRWR